MKEIQLKKRWKNTKNSCFKKEANKFQISLSM